VNDTRALSGSQIGGVDDSSDSRVLAFANTIAFLQTFPSVGSRVGGITPPLPVRLTPFLATQFRYAWTELPA
jgi:hypothetical protein